MSYWLANVEKFEDFPFSCSTSSSRGRLDLLIFVQMGAPLALIDVLKALQWNHWHLLDTKQSKFIESSTLMFYRQNTQM